MTREEMLKSLESKFKNETIDFFKKSEKIITAAKIPEIEKYEKILIKQKEKVIQLEAEIKEHQKKADDLSMQQKFKEAQKFYAKVKKAKAKMPGLKKVIPETERKIKEAKEKPAEDSKPEFETINRATALWTLQKSEITEEEYQEKAFQ